MAGEAFANASAHTGLALSVRTDPLTGCLNHAALHDGLRREVERAERADDGVLSLILLDLDRLRGVDEEEDSPLHDEILRRAGRAAHHDAAVRPRGALRRAEFALVTADAGEQQACRDRRARGGPAGGGARRPRGRRGGHRDRGRRAVQARA